MPQPRLYSPALLALATELADHPLLEGLSRRAEARSRTCGSTVVLGCDVDAGGMVTRLGMQVTACAVGQASAALLARSAVGRSAAQVERTLAGIEAWLAGEQPLPDWPDLALIEAAQAHPGRHGALLLPWKAALAALSTGSATG